MSTDILLLMRFRTVTIIVIYYTDFVLCRYRRTRYFSCNSYEHFVMLNPNIVIY